ncbi:phosphonate metabolism transcriptional regulator PhnF [Chitiniphilus eburneus]|uniref:Phosphonate metabolism transcriptional regulator PhnF n=1 Tax=Chitiniphilus eburneus TaxID=2571148 RepID=A0A4U0P9W5_9NEIS|nr:phosphonate metabolism transcriptional regulator PhnF [Chitiniphilus eburneus]TJZ64373.1 phosphonate metabolism transcriptional regulator PhnF [Chitiniphilus eburneus]
MIQRGSGVAVWRQIEQTIEEEITSQRYRVGERLPTEAEFAARFEVNRHTIRRAVAALETRGLVRVEQGRGIFLQDYAVHYTVGKRTRFSESLKRLQREGQIEVLRSQEIPASAKVAQALRLAEGERVLQVDSLARADGGVVSVTTRFFPAQRFAGLAEVYAETGSITTAMHRYGVADYERLESRITARLPEEQVARHLQRPKNQPVLQVEGINIDQHGIPIEFGISRLAGDAVQLVVGGDEG